jgi:hypothetical protein
MDRVGFSMAGFGSGGSEFRNKEWIAVPKFGREGEGSWPFDSAQGLRELGRGI